MPPGNEAHEAPSNGASASAYEKLQRGHTSQPWWLNYDQALDLQSPAQQNPIKPPPPPQHKGLRQPTYHSGKTYDCDVCPYQATQLSSLKRHKLAKHSGAQFNCDQCEYIGTTQ